MVLDGFEERVRSVNWAQYETAYGSADSATSGGGPSGTVADQLVRLTAQDPEDVMNATHQLWCGLCHQHAYVSSAALPALPFIIEVLDTADEVLIVELLDILLGFTVCSAVPEAMPRDFDYLPYLNGSRKKVRDNFDSFDGLLQASSKEIARIAGVSDFYADSIYRLLHPQELQKWIYDLLQAMQLQLPRLTALRANSTSEDIAYFVGEIVDILTGREKEAQVDMQIGLKKWFDQARCRQDESRLREIVQQSNYSFDSYGPGQLPGQHTTFSIHVPKSMTDQFIETLLQARFAAGSYVIRCDDVRVPL